MKDLVDELGFMKISKVFDHYNLISPSTGAENIYVHFEHLPTINSFENDLSLNQIISRAVSALLAQTDSRNILNAGYVKSANGINLSGVAFHSKFPNTTTNFFKFKYWADIFKVFGDELSVFVLSRCTIIDRSAGKNVLLAGNIWKLSEIYNRPKYGMVSRKSLFIKQGALKKIDLGDLIKSLYFVDGQPGNSPIVSRVTAEYINEKVNIKGLNSFVKKINGLKMHSIFLTYFKNENECIPGSSMVDNEINQDKIVNFLFCIAKKTLGECISFYNFRVLKSKLIMLIKRNKFEDISFPELRKYFRISDTKLFNSGSTHTSQIDFICKSFIITQFVVFLIERVFIPIVSQYFYVTETNYSKLKVFYFVRKVWNIFSADAIGRFLENFKEISKQPVFSKIRAIPKKKDFRVITNCYNSKDIRLANYILKTEMQHKLGNSLLSHRDIISKLNSYRCEDKGPSYMLKIDLKKCFDKIPHPQLQVILKSLFLDSTYRVRKYYILEKISGRSKIKMVRREGHRRISFYDLMKEEKLNHNQIICDNVYDDERTKFSLIKSIEQGIFNNVIKYKNRYYKQILGIPQGSIISPLLCSIYLSMIDMQYLNDIMINGFFRRYIDDFIVISPNIQEPLALLRKITELKHLGLEVNESKIESNFVCPEFAALGFKLECPSEKYIQWCGLKIYSESLGVKCNYGIESMNYSCVVNGTPSGRRMFGKLQRDFQRRMSPVFISKINQCRFMNIYDTFFLLGRKMIILSKRLDYINPDFIAKVCDDFVSYSSRILTRRGIFLEPKKITIIGAKAFKNSGLEDFVDKIRTGGNQEPRRKLKFNRDDQP